MDDPEILESDLWQSLEEAKKDIKRLEEENKKLRDIILSGNAWNEEVAKMRKKLQKIR
jgi:hypothetical protein